MQGFEPADKMAWPIYEVINEYKLLILKANAARLLGLAPGSA